jgi:hypothetical protein
VAAIEIQPTAVDTPGGGLMPYAAPRDGEYTPAVMTAAAAKALDEQVRACTRAVLREGTDYGIIPGTNGEKTLWRPGAQKLLQWFGFSVSCERVEVERDDDGRKHGITYRAIVTRRLPDGSVDTLATCEGTADYDESKFYQSAEEVQRRARERERRNAETYHRPANPKKWQDLGEYRADWNALMKRAQKRAIVGAVVDATAAGGIFSDREEDDSSATQPDGGPDLAARMLDEAAAFTTQAAAERIWRDSAAAAREGLITPNQATHVQNRVRVRLKSLQQAARPVHVGDLARQAAQDASPAEDTPPTPPQAEPAGEAPNPPLPGEDEPVTPEPDDTDYDTPGTRTDAQVGKLQTVYHAQLGFTRAERDATLTASEEIIRRGLLGPHDGHTHNNLSFNEAKLLIDTLERCGTRANLVALLASGEVPGDG